MAQDNQLVRDGIAAYKAGEKERARQLLAQAVKEDGSNEQAWYYLAAAETSPARRKQCLEMVVKLNPSNTKAQEMLAKINERMETANSGGPSRPGPAAAAASPPAGSFKLPVDIPGAPEAVTPQELVSSGIALLKNSVGIFLKRPGAYEDEIQRATWWRFWLTVATGSVVTAIFTALGSLFLEFRLSTMVSGYYSPDVLTPILTFIFSIPINMAAVYAGCYASHWYATTQAGGQSSLVQHSHMMAAAWLPGSVVSSALGAVVSLVFGATASINLLFSPGGLAFFGLGLIIAVIVSIGVALYTLSIQLRGVQTLYKFTGTPMWITLGIMLIGTGIVYGLLDNILPG